MAGHCDHPSGGKFRGARASARRAPRIEAFRAGRRIELQPLQDGPLAHLPDLPAIDAASTAAYTRAVLDGTLPVPAPIAQQVAHILQELTHHEPAPSAPFAAAVA